MTSIDLVAEAARWQRRARRLEQAARRERTLRRAATGFLAKPFPLALENALSQLRNALPVPRAYAVLGDAWPALADGSQPGDLALEPAWQRELGDTFLSWACLHVRGGPPLHWSIDGARPRGGPSPRSPACRSLYWQPIAAPGAPAEVSGFLGCHAQHEIHLSADKLELLREMATVIRLAHARQRPGLPTSRSASTTGS